MAVDCAAEIDAAATDATTPVAEHVAASEVSDADEFQNTEPTAERAEFVVVLASWLIASTFPEEERVDAAVVRATVAFHATVDAIDDVELSVVLETDPEVTTAPDASAVADAVVRATVAFQKTDPDAASVAASDVSDA